MFLWGEKIWAFISQCLEWFYHVLGIRHYFQETPHIVFLFGRCNHGVGDGFFELLHVFYLELSMAIRSLFHETHRENT